jgi:hypothetical protein
MKITEQQIADAILHATVWEGAATQTRENAHRRQSIVQQDPQGTAGHLHALADFALIVAGNYRKVVNTGEVEP